MSGRQPRITGVARIDELISDFEVLDVGELHVHVEEVRTMRARAAVAAALRHDDHPEIVRERVLDRRADALKVPGRGQQLGDPRRSSISGQHPRKYTVDPQEGDLRRACRSLNWLGFPAWKAVSQNRPPTGSSARACGLPIAKLRTAQPTR